MHSYSIPTFWIPTFQRSLERAWRVWWSPRLVGASEEHVMDKVKKRAAHKNFESIEGKTSNSSFLSFSDVVIQSNLSNIGVNLGKNDSEISYSIKFLKH
jgi:hypothetical protein